MSGAQKQTPKLFFAAAPSALVQSALRRPAPTPAKPWTRRRQRLSTHARPPLRRSRRARARPARRAPPRRTPARIVQASSLGAEDQVVTDLIARYRLPITVATLDTGKLHDETLALIDVVRERYGVRDRALPAGARGGGHVRRPPRRRRDAAQRRAAQGLLRAAQGRAARPHARRPRRLGHRPAPRAVERAQRRRVRGSRRRRPRQAQPARRLELGRRLALHPDLRRPLQRACTTASIRASAARRARAPSPSARTSAPVAGGGSRAPRSAACTSSAPRAPMESTA